MIATDAAGFQMDLIPSVRLSEEWESNVFDTEDDEVSSFATRLTPGLALRFTSADNVTVQISGNYEKVWYHDPEANDADYDTWYFRIDSTGGWALTPTFSMLPSVYYLNTRNSDRRAELVSTGDQVAPQGAIINYGDTKSEEFGGGLAFAYLATPNLTIGITGNYSEQRFPDDDGLGEELTDSTQFGGAASVSYLFSPRTSLGISAGGAHQTYENNPDSDTVTVSILYDHQFSPALRFDATLGVSKVRQKEAPGTPRQDESSPSGNFNLSYTRETFTARAFGDYSYSGGSGAGEATRQWTTGLEITGLFTREWSWNLLGAYQVSRSVFETDKVDLTTVYGTAGLRYQFLEWASLDLTGSLNRQTSDGQFGETLNNYNALLGLTIGKPYKVF
jgi:hypothetical protein